MASSKKGGENGKLERGVNGRRSSKLKEGPVGEFFLNLFWCQFVLAVTPPPPADVVSSRQLAHQHQSQQYLYNYPSGLSLYFRHSTVFLPPKVNIFTYCQSLSAGLVHSFMRVVPLLSLSCLQLRPRPVKSYPDRLGTYVHFAFIINHSRFVSLSFNSRR